MPMMPDDNGDDYGQWENILKLTLMLGASTTGLTQAQIAEELDVAPRTVQRMLKAVNRCFRQMVVWERREKGQKYFRLQAPQLDIVALADLAVFSQEVLAAFPPAVLALRQLNLNAQAEDLERAGARLRLLLNQYSQEETKRARAARARAIDLEDLLRYEGLARRPGPSRSGDEDVVEDLREAMQSCRQVKIIYTAREGPAKEFTLIPLGFLYGERRHYLVASHADGYDSGKPHHFILNRIQSVEKLAIPFDEDPDFSLEAHAARSFGTYQEEPFEVEWLFSPAAAAEAESYIFHPNQQTSRHADGSLTVRFTAGGRLEMAWHLCTWGREVKVVKPADFWESVRKDLPEF